MEPKPEEREELAVGRISRGKRAVLTEGAQQLQRPWGRNKLSLFWEQGGGQCGWRNVFEGGFGERRGARLIRVLQAE